MKQEHKDILISIGLWIGAIFCLILLGLMLIMTFNMPTLDSSPTFVLTLGPNGQITVSELVSGDLTSATLSQLYTSQRDIAGASKLLEMQIMRNLS